MKYGFCAILLFLISAATSFAGVSISSPAKDDHLNSPFLLAASASSCSSQPTHSMGYSLDNSSDTKMFSGDSSINTSVTASTGTHTVHVKAWGDKGAVCVTDVAITITSATSEASTSSSSSSSISVGSPSHGQTVTSPFSVIASASSCSSQSVSSMGYSLDNSSDTTMFHGSTSIDAKASASAGTHTLHVKAWGNKGATCSAAVPITVSKVMGDVASNTSVVPASAVSVSNVEVLGSWSAKNDSGGSGSSSGKMSVVGSPSHSGSSRKFVTTYKNSGDERYSVSFGDNTTATNFFYDAWVYPTSSADKIANLEMDVNQTMPNGQTVIFGMQCDGNSGKWAYTENTGTAAHPSGKWASSSAKCNIANWTKDKWHHVQISCSRTSTGKITYKSVWLDGVQSTINKTVFGARSLGWGTTLSSNFQVDGKGSSGTSTIYLDSLKISRW
jgi:hypothetical protein